MDIENHGLNAGFEIWYSDVASFFGRRARTVLAGTEERVSTWRIEKDGRGDEASGRYVTFRIYHPHKRLRFDWMKVFGEPFDDAAAAEAAAAIAAVSTSAYGQGRRLFEAPNASEPVSEPVLEPSPSPKPRPSPEPSPGDEDGTSAEGEEGAWWTQLHPRLEANYLYPRRAPPGFEGHSAGASVALSIAMALPFINGQPSLREAQRLTLEETCHWLDADRGCELGDNETNIYDLDDADNLTTATPHPHDTAWALLVLSQIVEPTVHSLVQDTLICASDALCGDNCAQCDRGGPLRGTATAEEVLRRVEAGLGVRGRGKKRQSRSVLECARSIGCLGEIATEVAVSSGAGAALPITQRIERVARANAVLLDAAHAEFTRPASNGTSERKEARRLLIEAHRNATAAAGAATPFATLSDEEHGEGRRLEEKVRQAHDELTPLQQEMKAQTNATCRHIDSGNSTAAHDSHVKASGYWMRMLGGGNNAKGQGHVCVDCQAQHRTTACRAHFALVGRRLQRMREVDARKAKEEPEQTRAERRRRMEEHAREKLGEACCGRYPDGHVECGEKFCAMHMRNSVVKRVGRVSRRMHETGHPNAQNHFGIAAHMGIDILDPEEHRDPECRGKRNGDDPFAISDAECMARSMAHALAERHGLSYEAVKGKLEEMGYDLGTMMHGAARATGVVRDRHTQGGAKHRSEYEKQRATDETHANALMRASQERRRAGTAAVAEEGRRLAQLPSSRNYEAREMGGHAVQAGAMKRQMHNASEIVHRRLMRIDAAAVQATGRHSRARAFTTHSRRHLTPRPDELAWHTATSTLHGPLTVLLALSAEEDSIVGRFSNGVSKFNELRVRTTAAFVKGRRRLHAREAASRQRRLDASSGTRTGEAHAFYDRVEARLSDSHARKLSNGPPRPQRVLHELPERHALSWVHEVVDWQEVVTHGSNLYDVMRRRLAARAKGKHTHAQITKAHPTGWSLLDNPKYTQPSVLGDAVRRVLHRKENKGQDPPWHHQNLRHRVRRRMEEEGSVSHVRRLAVAFLEGTIAAPFSFADKMLPNGVITPQSEVSLWEAIIRYIVSSTIGCYFVKPTKGAVSTFGGGSFGGDGDMLGVLRPTEEKLCFPAVCLRSNQTRARPDDAYRLRLFPACADPNFTAVHGALPHDHEHGGRRPEEAHVPRDV